MGSQMRPTVVPSEFVVMFTYHAPDADHPAILRDALKGKAPCTYELMSRPASKSPARQSDFALVTIEEGCVNDLKDAWCQSDAIKGVFPHHQFTRPLWMRVLEGPEEADYIQASTMRTLKMVPFDVVKALNVERLWKSGTKGRGVKVAVFDTGISRRHRHFSGKVPIKTCAVYTGDKTCEDGHGHGTFVAGVIASAADCIGIVPDAELHIFKVFTDKQTSYTSWYLDAFNHAIQDEVDVINLSIGGPDYMDQPFVQKVWEVSASGATIVSAIGNDGPLYGTLSNPADMMDVIGVGATTQTQKMARFSARGMTLWELPSGHGRFKPDVVTYGEALRGSNRQGGCKMLSGTSVASPVVAGATALLVAIAKLNNRSSNPAVLKQVLTASARKLPEAGIFEQGAGLMDIEGAAAMIAGYVPHVSFLPRVLNFSDCPYMWPYCTQPLYYTAAPVRFNVTVLNGLGVVGRIVRNPEWVILRGPDILDVRTSFSDPIWPWAGYIAIEITVTKAGSSFQGVLEGQLYLEVESPVSKHTAASLSAEFTYPIEEGFEYVGDTVFSGPAKNASICFDFCLGKARCTHWTFAAQEHRCLCKDSAGRRIAAANHTSGRIATSGTVVSGAVLPIQVEVIPPPPRAKRILWDQFHNIQYPPYFIPRDDLHVVSDLMDWNGDHPYTNFREMYMFLRRNGYFLEILGSDFLTFDASLYGALLIVDSEEDFFFEEVTKLQDDVTQKGLTLIVFADWYNRALINSVTFFDDNTHDWWHTEIGGANVPALNDLLQPFNISFGGNVWDGDISKMEGMRFRYSSGTSIRSFPARGWLLRAHLTQRVARGQWNTVIADQDAAILGLTHPSSGKVAVFGDSNCLDAAHNALWCFPLLLAMLKYSEGYHINSVLPGLEQLQNTFEDPTNLLPAAPNATLWSSVSLVTSLGRNRTQAISTGQWDPYGLTTRQARHTDAMAFASRARTAGRRAFPPSEKTADTTVEESFPSGHYGHRHSLVSQQYIVLTMVPSTGLAVIVLLSIRRRKRSSSRLTAPDKSSASRPV